MIVNRDPLRFTGGNWTSTHEYGNCLVNHARQLYYIEIPKCASSWARKFLDEIGPTNHPDSDWVTSNFVTEEYLDSYQPLILLRNPIDRWISADPVKDKLLGMNQHELQLFFETLPSLRPDEHMCKQVDFLRGVDLSNALFFRVGADLVVQFQTYLLNQGFQAQIAPMAENTRPPSQEVKEREQYWRKLFQNPEWFWLFKEYVAEDYKLLCSVNFPT